MRMWRKICHCQLRSVGQDWCRSFVIGCQRGVLHSTMLNDPRGWKLNLLVLISTARSNFIDLSIAWFNESFVFFCECLTARCGLTLINSQVLELLVFQVFGNDSQIWVRLCLNLSINHIWCGNYLALSRMSVHYYPDFFVWQQSRNLFLNIYIYMCWH